MHESKLNFARTKSQLRHPLDSLDLNLFCPYLANRSSDFDVLPVYGLGSMRTSQRYPDQGKIMFESKSQTWTLSINDGQIRSTSVNVKNFSGMFRDGVLHWSGLQLYKISTPVDSWLYRYGRILVEIHSI